MATGGQHHIRLRVGGAVTVAVALAAATGSGPITAAAQGAATTAPSLAACAYGSDVPGLTGYLSNAVTTAAESYADGVSADASPSQATASSTFAAAAAAYVYGLAPVAEQEQLAALTPNTMLSIGALATPQNQGIVSPDDNVAPTVARIDLRGGPVVIDVPNTNGRFYTFQFLDAYTNAFAYLGSGSSGTEAGSYALEPPGYTGTLPAGVTGIQSPTNTVWLIGRILVQNSSDLATVMGLQEQYALTPLSDWIMGDRRNSLVTDTYPAQSAPSIPTGTAFITALNDKLSLDPPPAADSCALQAMSVAGVDAPGADTAGAVGRGAHGPVRQAASASVDTAAVAAGTAFGAQVVASAATTLDSYSDAMNNGWVIYGSWIGNYGTAYLARAIVAQYGLGANTPTEAIYPTATTDIDGQTLSGSTDYTITFPPGELPPVGGFWSLTMYDPSLQLTANSLNRYEIGGYTPGLVVAPDGSVTIHVQNQEPSTPAEQANWLPAPAGQFVLMLRLYEPASAALDGSWKPPPVKPVTTVTATTSAPAISRLSVKPSSFRPAKGGGTESPHGPGVVTYRDTEQGTTDFELIKLGAHGHHQRVGRFSHKGRSGTNRVRITGRVHGRPLAKGRYLVTAQAHHGSSVSSTVKAHFSIT